MARSKISVLTTLYILLLCVFANAQVTDPFPRSIPETEGVSSAEIIQFLDAAAKSKNELHSFMMLRHGKVIAEGWWNPYRSDLKHSMYSTSKSFTASAIGFAVSEHRLSVDDKIISFFPDDLPQTVSPYLAALRVKDVLSMSAGQEPDPTYRIGIDSNWIKSFLSAPIAHQPGTKFLYNTLCTYMLSAIIQKVTGEKLIDYLTPRLFQPLGITGMDWESDPAGINVGGWGLRIKTEDMAKFGQLFLQKGSWKGKQVLPEEWVKDASTLKIMQNPGISQGKRDSSDWEQGYCYQMWRCRNNAFRADGAYGQFIIVMPDQDAVVVLTSETPDMQDEINLVWQYLLPAIKKEALPANKKATAALQKQLLTAALPIPASSILPKIKDISGKTFSMSPNTQFVQQMNFQFKKDICELTIQIKSDTFKLNFGAAKWVAGTTKKLGPSLVGGAKGYFVGLSASKIAGSYRWLDENSLELTLRYIESPHTETFTCHFDQNNLSVDLQNTAFRNNKQEIKGVYLQNGPKPVQLIVRGDDMGYTHSGNMALIKSYKEGIEQSIEVIVPSPWFPEAVKLLEQNPGVDIGVHLALSSEWENIKWRPLTDCKSLRDKDGYFYPMIFPNKNYPGQSLSENKWTIEDIEKEFRAQIEMAIQKIPRVSHISAHMNCVMISDEVNAMTKKLAKEYKIDIDLADYGVKWIGYEGPSKTGAEKIQSFINVLKQLEPGKTYFFIDHPGFNDAELQAVYHIGYEQVATDRQGVTDLFTDAGVKAFILQNGIQLMSYKDLLKK